MNRGERGFEKGLVGRVKFIDSLRKEVSFEGCLYFSLSFQKFMKGNLYYLVYRCHVDEKIFLGIIFRFDSFRF